MSRLVPKLEEDPIPVGARLQRWLRNRACDDEPRRQRTPRQPRDREEKQMYPKRMVRQVLGAGMLTILILALTACGSGSAQEGAKGRPLPQEQGALRPGQYHSVKFKPPLSFEVGKGWSTTAKQLSDYIELGQPGEIGITNLRERQGSLQTRHDRCGRCPQRPGRMVTAAPLPKNLQTTAGHARGSQGRAARSARRGLAQGLLRSVWQGVSDCVDIAPLSNDAASRYFKEVNRA